MSGYLVSSGVTSGIILSANGDNLTVCSGGTAIGTIQYGGNITVLEGGIASQTRLFDWGMNVEKGGTAIDVTLEGSQWAHIHTLSGGTTISATANRGGEIIVSSGGYATSLTIGSGGKLTIDRGSSTDIKILDGGQMSATIDEGTNIEGSIVGTSFIVKDGKMSNSMIERGSYYLQNGGSFENVTIAENGRLYVSSGGLANSVFVRNRSASLWSDNYHLTILLSGIAENATVESGGKMVVSFGGTANNTVINQGGSFSVSSGGTATIAFNPWQGTITSNTGATVTYLERDAKVYYGWNRGLISKTDFMDSLVIEAGKSAIVYSGGVANNTFIKDNGYLYVSSGGIVTLAFNPWEKGTIVSSNGATVTHLERDANVYYGGVNGFISKANSMDSVNVSSGNSIIVYSGGTVGNACIYSNGIIYVSSGGTATIAFNPWQGTIVSSAGAAVTYLERDARVYYGGGNGLISSANTLEALHLDNDTSAIIYSGGIANNIDAEWNSYLIVSSGGTANNTAVHYAHLVVSSGGTANNTTVREFDGYANGGDTVIFNGGIANNIIVNWHGSLTVSNGGTANNVMINSSGTLTVNSGGTVSIVFNPWQGKINSNYGANVTYLKRDENVYYGAYAGIISKTSVIDSLNIESGKSVIVYSEGVANNLSVNQGANLYVLNGGVTNNTTINSSGTFTIYSGGTANNVIWTPCNGFLRIEDGAHVTFASLIEGVFYGGGGMLSANAMTMENTVVQKGQEMYIMSNGLANSTTVSSGGSTYLSCGGTANNTTIFSSGFMCISSGGTAAHIVANSGALLDLSIAPDTYIEGTFSDSAFEIKEGVATYYSVNSGNILRISSGGVTSRTYVYYGGKLNVSNGGTASRTTLSNGTMNITTGGVTNSTTLNGGKLHISSGGIANNVILNSAVAVPESTEGNFYSYDEIGSGMHVSCGGIGNNITINSDILFVSSGGVVDTVVVANNSGCLNVLSGGTARNITASSTRLCFDIAPDTYIAGTSSGVTFEIKDGLVSDYTISQNGSLNIFSGGTANNVTINKNGKMTVLAGGITKSTNINGNMWVSSGGMASSTIINGSMWISGGVASATTVNASLWVSSGGVIDNTTINNGGKVWIYNGAEADNTEINNGSMWISSGGVASNIRINSGGNVSIQHAKLTGKITIANGGVIHAGQGTVIDFDISHLAPGTGARLNNLSQVKDDSPAFTLTVSDLQWNGDYMLAKRATEFDNLISVKSLSNETIHMVEVGETVNVDGVEYTLKLTGDTLSVTVTGGRDIPIIPVSADISELTNQDVTLTAGFSDDAIMREYSFDNEIWHVYTEPVKCTVNGTVYFLGKDQRGYVNEIASYEVMNIDKIKPEAPVATADVMTPTTGNVTVSAIFSEDSIVQEYSQDEEKWESYTGGVLLKENGVVYFRGTDAAGNMSEITTFSVDYIDRTPPKKPTAVADITSLTEGIVNVSASFSEDSDKKEYSLDKEAWFDYTAPIKLSENGSVFFRGTDKAGNESEIVEYKVENIVTRYVGIELIEETRAVSSGKVYEKTIINYGASMFVYSDGVVSDTTINDAGWMFISSGGIAEITTINSAGLLWIYDGGTANNNTVSKGGMATFAGGTANSTVVSDKGLFLVGGVANNTTVDSGGSVHVSSGGTANSITVNSNGSIYIAPGATVNSIVENGGYVGLIAYTNISFVSNALSGLSLSKTSASIHSNTTADSTAINSGGSMTIFAGGQANNTTINSSGYLDVRSKGEVNGTVINTNGRVIVSSGGTANNTTLNSNGFLTIESGGTATDTTVLSSGYLCVSSGGFANSCLVDSYGVLNVYAGGSVTNLIENGGCIDIADGANVTFIENTFNGLILSNNKATVHSGTTANSTTVNANLYIYSGGVANDTTLRGWLHVFSGGHISNTSVYERGSLCLSGGTATSAEVNYWGYIYVSSGGIITDTMINSGGWMYVSSGGMANNTVLNGNGYFAMLHVTNGGTANSTTINGFGSMHVSIGGKANDITVNNKGELNISSGATVSNVKINSGGSVIVDQGKLTGTIAIAGQLIFAKETSVSIGEETTIDFNISELSPESSAQINDLSIIHGAPLYTLTVSESQETGSYTLAKGAANFNSTISVQNAPGKSFGTLSIGESIEVGDNTFELKLDDESLILSIAETKPIDIVAPTVSNIQASTTAMTNQKVVLTADFADDVELKQSLYRIGETDNWKDYSEGVTVTENATVYFKAVDAAGNESEVISYTVSNIDRDAPTEPFGLMAVVSDPTVVLIWSPSTDTASGIKEYVVKYSCNGQTFTASVNNTNYVLTGLASGSWSWGVQAVDIAGNESALVAGNSFVVSGAVIIPENLVGTPEKVSWTSTGAEQYIVEYSTDNFAHVIQVVTSAPATDLLDLPAGTYQWRVKTDDDNSDWAVGEAFEAKVEVDDKPKVVQSNADGNDDLFFATASGTWENIYYAQNVGSVNDWTGTKEIISADGKGRIQNLFFGSSDPNVLCLTDGENGDAIFVDDVYTELPESVAEHTARLYKIQEVRAGAGDDIVDMTSQRFEYVGDGLTIRGGDGNDTIWATKGNNFLFGDAGNDRIVGASGNDVIAGGIGIDRMQGGGGDDIFTFCDNWGADEVEQLGTGKVTLWFASGDESKWNAEKLTYTDGDNSVTVKGVASVTLKFGNDGSEQYAALASAGAFAEFTSQKIFEESGKGLLA